MRILFVFVFLLGLFSCGETANYSTIKIGNLEVMTEDLGKMNWDDAMKACENLGDGWRLPTKDELSFLCENKEKIGGFNGAIWSSTEGDDVTAWTQYFLVDYQIDFYKSSTCYVRAVRSKQ